MRSRIVVLSVTAGLFSILVGCTEKDAPFSPMSQPRSLSQSFAPMTSCGASFRAISRDTDSLMARYGIGTAVDTVDICESWTGSDYDYQVVAVGSSENIPGFTDTVQTIKYQDGYVRGYTQTGAGAADPGSVGSSSFDLVQADDPTRQASYDDPYYGVSSADPLECSPTPCAASSVNGATGRPKGGLITLVQRALSGAETPDTLFKKHGITRRGVRALLNASEEISASPNGYRRFRGVQGDRVVIRSIDRVTQLLMEVESSSPDEVMRVKHSWTKVRGGYLLARSDYVVTDQIDGEALTSFGEVELSNVTIASTAHTQLIAVPSSH